MSLIFDGLLLCLGCIWAFFAVTRYPIWKGTSLAGGLLPLVASSILIILVLFRIIAFLKNNKVNKEYFKTTFHEINWKCMIPLLIGISILLGTKVLGLFISLTIMLFCWLKFLSKYNWKKSIITTVCVMALMYGIFIGWLAVPLPKGLLELI